MRALFFIFRQTLANLWAAKTPVIGAIVTIGLSLSIIIGLVAVSAKGLRSFDYFKHKFQMEVFLKANATESEIKSLHNKLSEINQIKSIRFISRQEAAKIFEREFGEKIIDVLGENPLMPSFQLRFYRKMTHPAIIENVKLRIQEMDAVDEVKYHKEILLMVERYFRLIVVVGTAIVILAGTAMNILIKNTIRISIFARRKQIEILRLLGAGNFFIRLPYILEGLIEGALGGALAATILTFGHKMLNYATEVFLNVSISSSDLIWPVSVALGVLIGISSSSNSVQRYLQSIH
jgi:cell division transport system permease protein